LAHQKSIPVAVYGSVPNTINKSVSIAAYVLVVASQVALGQREFVSGFQDKSKNKKETRYMPSNMVWQKGKKINEVR